jgi:uncharacterized protein YydD (DUF2326 family)
MLVEITSSLPSFKTVHLEPGFNLVVAERTTEATAKDSRNGLGKSTLIEIIHFCLGSRLATKSSVRKLAGATFTLTFRVGQGGELLKVSRSVDAPSKVTVEGELKGLPSAQLDLFIDDPEVPVDSWNKILDDLMFGIPSTDLEYKPSSRILLGYAIRRGAAAFVEPSKTFSQQPTWQSQVAVSFLLGLNWEYASKVQTLRDKRDALLRLRTATDEGFLPYFKIDAGELDARRLRLQLKLEESRAKLAGFNLLPEYESVAADADNLSSQIRTLQDQSRHSSALLERYEEALEETDLVSADSVQELFRNAEILLADNVVKRLEEVEQFHRDIMRNRRLFLRDEIERLRNSIAEAARQASDLDAQRSSLLRILESHGALNEFSALHESVESLAGELREVEHRLSVIRDIRTAESDLRLEGEMVFRAASTNFEELRGVRDRAISIFEQIVGKLYSAGGNLAMDMTKTGFAFSTSVERRGSQGVERMLLFAFDLTLSVLWSDREPSPGFLIHDSTIFDGVDERQRATAMLTASEMCELHGIQYLLLLNSDEVPFTELDGRLDVDSFTRLTLTDSTPSGSLVGFRF